METAGVVLLPIAEIEASPRKGPTSTHASVSDAEKRRRKSLAVRKEAARAAIQNMSETARTKEVDAGFWRMLIVLARGSYHSSSSTRTMEKQLSRLSGAEARALLLELFLEDCVEYFDGEYPASFRAAAKYYGLDLRAIEKRIKAAAAEKAAAKKKTGSRKK